VPLFVKTVDDASTKVVSDFAAADFLLETFDDPTFFGLAFLDGGSHRVVVPLGHLLHAASKCMKPYLIIFVLQLGDQPLAEDHSPHELE
jgi:hypothetical protein